MKFKRVTIQNFLSYKEKQTFEFTGKGITLLLGKNGEGKSAIASAIYFALFGKSDRGKLDNLVNFDIGKNCLVELEFEKNNKFYKIVRGLKPPKFEIYVNDKKLEDGLVKERQARLNEILGFNETIFYQLIYLGTNTKNFLDLNKKERENFINVILDIDEINLLIENAKNYLKHLKTQKEILESKINYISFDIKKIKDEYNAKKEEVLKIVEHFDNFIKFKNAYENKNYALLYQLADMYELLKNTKYYKLVEKEWESIFEKAKNEAINGNVNRAKELLKNFLPVSQKKALINTLLQEAELFKLLKEKIAKKDFKGFFAIIKTHPELKDTKEYKTVIEYANKLYLKAGETLEKENFDAVLKTQAVVLYHL